MAIFPDLLRPAALASAVLLLGACAYQPPPASNDPGFVPETRINTALRDLPPASRTPVVAVYRFADQTGQHKPSEQFAEYSRAVTQGGASLLVASLKEAGRGRWFQVVEREGLEDLLQERQIIRAVQQSNGQQLRPLLVAGVMLQGGIVAYDSNEMTGGAGARFLGIGANTEFRRDLVTVALRAVSTLTGEVLVSVDASKTIYSVGLQGSVFKFVSIDEILEVEAGVTSNEPAQLAVKQAIDMAVYRLVMEGALAGLWGFADGVDHQAILHEYREARRSGGTFSGVTSQSAVTMRSRPRENPEDPDVVSSS